MEECEFVLKEIKIIKKIQDESKKLTKESNNLINECLYNKNAESYNTTFEKVLTQVNDINKSIMELKGFVTTKFNENINSNPSNNDIFKEYEGILNAHLEKEKSILVHLLDWMNTLYEDAFKYSQIQIITSDDFDDCANYIYRDKIIPVDGIDFDVNVFCSIVSDLTRIDPDSVENEWNGKKSYFLYKNKIFESEYVHGQGSLYTLRILQPDEDCPKYAVNLKELFISYKHRFEEEFN
ncbi:MAG: hypothetical protein IJ193_00560 [Bacilli bacterium]|nr:hypothetical protein [Bacilli bacterium]